MYIYGRHIIINFASNFKQHYVFGFINHPNKCLNWILCIGPTHDACFLQLQSDYLLNFQFTTYLWSTSLKTPMPKSHVAINQ